MTEHSEQEQIRRDKLAKLRQKRYPFPNDAKVNASSADVLAAAVEDPSVAKRVTLAGRLTQIRVMGKAAFAHLLDGGGKIQIYVRGEALGEESYAEFKDFDLGDIIWVSGYAFVTKTGEKSLYVEALRLLVKALIPLPEKWHGLSDLEMRFRQRYVDLIANPEVRDVFKKRAQIIREVRAFLDEHGFMEVETPVLHYQAGGANARPFYTHHNALGADMVLRVALELPLKKLVVGGLERVYEIGRNFRNEGISKKHNPEFTMLEFYWAYKTYEDLMTFSEEMFCRVVQRVTGTLKVPFGEQQIDFTPPWPRISMKDSLYSIGAVDRRFDLDTTQGVQQAAKHHKIELIEPADWGRSLEQLWGELVEHKIINPVFIMHHPFSISPLARQNQSDGKVVDRFEILCMGMELGNAFSELNDVDDQRKRFEEQARRKAQGDEEANDVDEDFLRALEYGLPPTGGQGVGIDRLVMLLTNSPTIRDVLLFPQLKPKED